MPDLPIMLRVSGRRCVVVGGGPVAHRRAKAIVHAGGAVTVIAPRVDAAMQTLDVQIERRPYESEDLVGMFLVVVATDDPEINRAVAADARRLGVLLNRADDPGAGDLCIGAHEHHGPITIAVYTGGISSTAAGKIRRELSASLDPDWPRLLEIVGPYRTLLQERCRDTEDRRARLVQLASPRAMAILKEQGPESLQQFCNDIVAGTPPRSATDPNTRPSCTRP